MKPQKTNAQTANPAANEAPTGKPLTGTPVVAKPAIAKSPPAAPAAAKPVNAKSLTEGQRVYEAKRAAKAGMSLDKWLASKEREREAEARAKLKAVPVVKPAKPPGLLGRLLERAQRPFGS
ncbi:hypothetical protein [Rhodopila sp.]|uniref:hypothetical protein n=1 Tax=Rhodopila sp. TaxID=2480087 RepID=UPI003D11E128